MAPVFVVACFLCVANAFKYGSVDLLLRHGAHVNVMDDRGATPLQACTFHCIISRHSSDGLSVLRRLVAAGALLQAARGAVTTDQLVSQHCF